MTTEQHQHFQVVKLDLHSDPVVMQAKPGQPGVILGFSLNCVVVSCLFMQAIEPLMKAEQQQHAAASQVLKRKICCSLGLKQILQKTAKYKER